MKLLLSRNTKQLVLPTAAVAIAIVTAAATEGAFHYRFSNAHVATVFDIVSNAGMAVLWTLIAKINLAQIPQRQNIALFAAGGAGMAVAAAMHNFILLLSK